MCALGRSFDHSGYGVFSLNTKVSLGSAHSTFITDVNIKFQLFGILI